MWLSPGSHRALQVPLGTSFPDSRRVLQAAQGRGLGTLYTTVLRELRLWLPPPGSVSVAGGVPLWAGSGGMSRVLLLLSAESSRSARETPVVGRGCSRRRGDAPSLSPSPGVGGLASVGSKASSSAGGDRGVSAGDGGGTREEGRETGWGSLLSPEWSHRGCGSAVPTPLPHRRCRLSRCKVQGTAGVWWGAHTSEESGKGTQG